MTPTAFRFPNTLSSVDTGQGISSLLSSFTVNANLMPVADHFTVSATSALSSFMNTGGQVWGGPSGGSGAGSTTIYGEAAGVAQTGPNFTPGCSETLYAVTANDGSSGNASGVQSYILGTITLATLANGAALTLDPVPLPAALWLLGGGLLGLAGLGRRRSIQAM